MYTMRQQMRRVQFFREFQQICSANADGAAVKRCFMKVWDVYLSRTFPDLDHLEHTLTGIRLQNGEQHASDSLIFAVWYQHSAMQYTDIEASVKNAREALPQLGFSTHFVEKTAALIRSTAPGVAPAGQDALMLADANTYASYGVSWARTNDVLVLKAKQDNLTDDYVRNVISQKMTSLMAYKPYYSGALMKELGAATHHNIRDALFNRRYVAKDSPKRRKLTK